MFLRDLVQPRNIRTHLGASTTLIFLSFLLWWMDEYLVIHMHDIGRYVPRRSSPTEEHKDSPGGLNHSYIPQLSVMLDGHKSLYSSGI
jgi:hypothetical protein